MIHTKQSFKRDEETAPSDTYDCPLNDEMQGLNSDEEAELSAIYHRSLNERHQTISYT